MWIRVCETVGSLSVCPSVRANIRPPHATAAGLLLSAVSVGDVDRQRQAAGKLRSAANASSVTLTDDVVIS